MVDTVNEEIRIPDDKPPGWANSLMKWALTTPGLQSMVGQGVAVLTFTGRRTGSTYTVPVSYQRDGDTVTVITKRLRKWWRNFEAPAEVGVRLAGHTYRGEAQVEAGEAAKLQIMTELLRDRPVDRKAYGLAKDEVTKEKIERILPHIVVIRIAVTPEQ